ncbi:MAG: chemotaxis protein CheA [Desulfohalobiaceae bacterium]|nr:chemotaxis protein CheA [Desulfohalobiaceae bacterium]
MTQMQTTKTSLKGYIEETAEQFVMADVSDPGVLQTMSETFNKVFQSLQENFPRSARAAQAIRDLLLESMDKDKPLTDSDLQSLEKTITALQILVSTDVMEDELELPESLGFEAKGPEKKDPLKNGVTQLAAGVDQEIMDEYLAQQEAVLAEMEDLTLSYEKQPDSQILKELKRLLHTAKGEAGVIGLNHVAAVCHQVEDYIQEGEKNLEADLLLEFKDWFELTVNAVRNRSEIPEADSLMQALHENSGIEDEAEQDLPSSPDHQSSPSTDETTAEHAELLTPVAIEDPEITADFISETYEHFELSDENLVILENDPENEEAIASIFRAFHTIKGTTSFLGLTPISVLAHKAENLLDEVRKKRLNFEGLVVDSTFNALDLLKKMTQSLEEALNSGHEFVPDPELPSVFVQLKKAISGEASPGPEPIPDDDALSGSKEADSTSFEKVPEPEEHPSGGLPGQSNGAQAQSGKTVKQTMKIDADRIDLLLETIGELVIVESIVSQEASLLEGDSRDIERNLGQLTKITRSLQDMGMSMRLIPIDATFRKMGRLVRDLAKKSGKKIELSMEGRETELDKGMVEKLGDPLVHMIRNAVDHGIEHTAEDRKAAGKDPTGRIVLKAYHQGGNIHIDIMDDGRGLDREAIAAKAVERGIISNPENLKDEEIFALIFEPGFSTAKQVTDVSGRGVGMDVVKSNIEAMRGNIRIASTAGKGSTFTLVLPLTMAIIDGMIVRVGSERYILPLLSIIESFQPTKEMITTVSGKGETIPFRNRLLPLFRLADLFNINDAQTDPAKALVVVIEDSGRQFALLVDELLGQNQTVIKNLGQGLRDVEGIAGASIMPDGTPGLIIDVNGLVKLATA